MSETEQFTELSIISCRSRPLRLDFRLGWAPRKHLSRQSIDEVIDCHAFDEQYLFPCLWATFLLARQVTGPNLPLKGTVYSYGSET